MFGRQRVPPPRHVFGVTPHFARCVHDHDDIQDEIRQDDGDRQSDGFLEALQEHGGQQPNQQQRHPNGVVEGGRHEGVSNDVSGRIRRGQGNGDDEIGGGKPEQDQHERFAPPAWEQVLHPG